MITVAILLGPATFEQFYTKTLGLDQASYLSSYRNDWSWDYTKGLKEQGIDPILYLVSQQYKGIYNTEDGFKVRFIPLKKWYKLASKFRFPPKRFKVGTYSQSLINVIAFKNSLLSALEEDRINLLYIQEYWSTHFDILINNVEIPIIGVDQGGNDSLVKKSDKQKSLPQAYKLQCQTLEELEKVQNYTKNALFLPNGVDTDFYHPLSSSNSCDRLNTILTVARADDRQKRTSDLLKALHYLPNSWSLQIAGVGKDIKYLQNLTSKLNIVERVDFLGFIGDKNELRKKYHECTVFALPSAWEGLPLAALEAMSCGCAIVTTDIRAFDNIVIHEKTGIKVPVGHHIALAQGILRCYENREFLGKEAREIVVNSYSKEKLFSQLAEIIKSCPSLKTNFATSSMIKIS